MQVCDELKLTGINGEQHMIIDFHTHIFSKKIRENREKYFIPEPAFKLLYTSPKSKLLGVSEIISSMDEQGVDKSVIERRKYDP